MKRIVEREKLKDGLKAWLERKASKVAVLDKCGAVWEGVGVRGLVQRFTTRRNGGVVNAMGQQEASVPTPMPEEKWGRRALERRRCEPTRAKVLGLRRLWEDIGGRPQEVRA